MGMSLLPVMLQPPEGLERRQAGDGLPTFVSVHPSSSAFARCGHNAAQRFGGDVPGAEITEAPAITSLTSASNLSGPTSLLTRARVQQ
jgi:hypothetical protein